MTALAWGQRISAAAAATTTRVDLVDFSSDDDAATTTTTTTATTQQLVASNPPNKHAQTTAANKNNQHHFWVPASAASQLSSSPFPAAATCRQTKASGLNIAGNSLVVQQIGACIGDSASSTSSHNGKAIARQLTNTGTTPDTTENVVSLPPPDCILSVAAATVRNTPVGPPAAAAATAAAAAAAAPSSPSKPGYTVGCSPFRPGAVRLTLRLRELERPVEDHGMVPASDAPLFRGIRHPAPLREPAACASVAMPELPDDLELRIPSSMLEGGALSSPQVESVSYATWRFEQRLNDGSRAGFLLGDGTGCGKGRCIGALLLDQWNRGRRQSIWISQSADLLQDAKRDFEDLGIKQHLPLLDLRNYPVRRGGLNRLPEEGILFLTYSLLASNAAERKKSRFKQVLKWLRSSAKKGSGLLVFDEAHRAKNIGTLAASFVEQLQTTLPDCAVMYATATGATEAKHLAYMVRLGLWGGGKECGFASFDELRKHLEQGGLAALEAHFAKLRSKGALSSRSLSFDGAELDVRVADLGSPKAFTEKMAAAAALWRDVLAAMNRAEEDPALRSWWELKRPRDAGMDAAAAATSDPRSAKGKQCQATTSTTATTTTAAAATTLRRKGPLLPFSLWAKRGRHQHAKDAAATKAFKASKATSAKAAATAAKAATTAAKNAGSLPSTAVGALFWSAQQRFFRSFIVASKVRDAVAIAEAALTRNESVVISLWSTHEARSSALMADTPPDVPVEEVSGPAMILDHFLHTHFKTRDPSGQPVQWAADALRDFQRRLRALELPKNPLDALIDALGGPSHVAELTGRSHRLVRCGDQWFWRPRIAPGAFESVNNAEKRAFQSGAKRVAIISEAASAGVSLHSDCGGSSSGSGSSPSSSSSSARRRRRRCMISLELPWAADKALQQLGRVHRSNQASAPRYVILVAPDNIEARFVSAVAHRLRKLGAITRGDQQAPLEGGAFGQPLDFHGEYGLKAFGHLMDGIYSGQPPRFRLHSSNVPTFFDTFGSSGWPRFARRARNAITALGLMPKKAQVSGRQRQGRAKASYYRGDAVTLNKFLNRLPLLSSDVQVPSLEVLSALISNLRSADRLGGGSPIDASLSSLNDLHRARSVVVLEEESFPNTTLKLVRLRLDLGLSWEEALALATASLKYCQERDSQQQQQQRRQQRRRRRIEGLYVPRRERLDGINDPVLALLQRRPDVPLDNSAAAAAKASASKVAVVGVDGGGGVGGSSGSSMSVPPAKRRRMLQQQQQQSQSAVKVESDSPEEDEEEDGDSDGASSLVVLHGPSMWYLRDGGRPITRKLLRKEYRRCKLPAQTTPTAPPLKPSSAAPLPTWKTVPVPVPVPVLQPPEASVAAAAAAAAAAARAGPVAAAAAAAAAAGEVVYCEGELEGAGEVASLEAHDEVQRTRSLWEQRFEISKTGNADRFREVCLLSGDDLFAARNIADTHLDHSCTRLVRVSLADGSALVGLTLPRARVPLLRGLLAHGCGAGNARTSAGKVGHQQMQNRLSPWEQAKTRSHARALAKANGLKRAKSEIENVRRPEVLTVMAKARAKMEAKARSQQCLRMTPVNVEDDDLPIELDDEEPARRRRKRKLNDISVVAGNGATSSKEAAAIVNLEQDQNDYHDLHHRQVVCAIDVDEEAEGGSGLEDVQIMAALPAPKQTIRKRRL